MYLYMFVDDLKKSIAKSAISIDAHSQYDKVGVFVCAWSQPTVW